MNEDFLEINTVEDLQKPLNIYNPYQQWWAAGMPSYATYNLEPWKQITLKFPTKEDREHLAKLCEFESLNDSTGSIWYPEKDRELNKTNRYVDVTKTYNTRYPIYIISKGRWESRITMRALDRLGVSYKIAIEPQEYDNYARTCGEENLLVLPFSNHGKGSGPARNWCWEHSLAEGYDRHWLMDDNIYEFWRLHKNKRYRVEKGSSIFRATEDFVDRYENIALTGFQYKFFCVDNYPYPPYILNTRIMSCFLIDNHIPHRWRGRYNEDVDLSIRVLKDGLCTCLIYAFLCGKARTGTIKGGNTSEVYNDYKEDASLKKSQMLVEMHPDVVTLAERYGRIHHHVDLERIITKDGKKARKNIPILKKDVYIHNKVDNYGMKLVRDFGSDAPYADPSFSENTFPQGRPHRR